MSSIVLYVARDKRRPRQYDVGSKLCLELIELMSLDDIEVIECGPRTAVPQWLVGTPTMCVDDDVMTGSAAVSFLHHMAVDHGATKSREHVAASKRKKGRMMFVDNNDDDDGYAVQARHTSSSSQSSQQMRPSLQLRPASHQHSVRTSASTGEVHGNQKEEEGQREYYMHAGRNPTREDTFNDDDQTERAENVDANGWIESMAGAYNERDDANEDEGSKLSHNDLMHVLEQKKLGVPRNTS
jgi:hypothetical protein